MSHLPIFPNTSKDEKANRKRLESDKRLTAAIKEVILAGRAAEVPNLMYLTDLISEASKRIPKDH
jgi:hypothetical protein